MTCFWRQPDNLCFPATQPRTPEAGLFRDVAPNAGATPLNVADRPVISRAARWFAAP